MRVILFSAAILFSAWSMAQSITGRVFHSGTGKPLAQANVNIKDLSTGTTSGEEGNYALKIPDNGLYTVVVSYIGFENVEKEVRVRQNRTVTLDFYLEEESSVLDEVGVDALRAKELTPIAFENVSEAEIDKRNLGQDLPVILNQSTSVVTTSDAGAGVGYTGMRIRGSDQARINVTINGIPVNDGESQGVFWVNMPDLASSVNSIQIQRGVGTSTNGAGAFGASVNIKTNDLRKDAFSKMNISGGSFNTQKYTLEMGTGLLEDHWVFQGRLSHISSDGYVDRARSNLKSYFFTGAYLGENFSLKSVVFGGNEETYQAWSGLDSATYYSDRTHNYEGAMYDEDGNLTGYYHDQVDNYSQHHAQLIYDQKLGDKLAMNISGHYTRGSGYYEQYRNDDDLSTYGLQPIPLADGDTAFSSDLIRRLWLDNYFAGLVYSFNYDLDKINFNLGGGYNTYKGDHYGEIIWARYASGSEKEDRFYFSDGLKNDFNVYLKTNIDITDQLRGFVDLQYRRVGYKGAGDDEDNRVFSFEGEYHFFNPKAGLTYQFSPEALVYASYGVANREPNRHDFIENEETPRPETLYDLEIGSRFSIGKSSFNVNLFRMDYRDQLVLTGQINNVGYPIRSNVGESYRMGVELSADMTILPDQLVWKPNFTYSNNKNIDYILDNNDGTVTNLGNTDIAFSPEIIAASVISWSPSFLEGFNISLQSKYVGEQYLDNTENDRYLLPDYFVSDILASYTLKQPFAESVRFQLMANNIFDEKYASNGYVYGTPYYYAQAGLNFLGGVTIAF